MSILEIRGLTKLFDNSAVLKDIHLSIDRGEVVVIVGPSGCGKSTLLRCLNGLEAIDGGEIRLDGQPMGRKPADLLRLRQKVGMVFQSYDLFPHMNIMDNLLLGPTKALGRSKAEVRTEAEVFLQRVGLLERKDAYPRQLSGGQKQRVAIVRAMLMHPEILLLDEITAALDPEMVHEVLNVVLDLASDGVTMAIVTHEMQFAKAVADRIVFMDKGNIVEQALPDRFFTVPATERARQFLSTFVFPEKPRPEKPKFAEDI